MLRFGRYVIAAGLMLPLATFAEEPATEGAGGLAEVLVTATKQREAVSAQDVAVAVTAFSGKELQKGFDSNLRSLTVRMPNVQLDGVGSQESTANFAIRGLATNSSIPIDPAVGTFYDGIYLGINAGVMYDFFDVESIEVLRGPQGLLFGRNVTGGAVVINHRKPSDEFETNFKVSTTHRLDSVVAASVSGPLTDTLSARLAGYYNDDQGWFTNEFDGDRFGLSKTWTVRPSLSWKPTDALELTFTGELGKYDGQGAASQNAGPGLGAYEGLHDRHSFSINIDEEGFGIGKWSMAVAELNYDIGPGKLTNILGWRAYKDDTLTDLDGRRERILHWLFQTDQDQLSDELRYAVNFDRVKLTTGLYWFTQDVEYLEARIVPLAVDNPSGVVPTTVGHLGGVLDSTTRAAFASADISLTEKLVLNVGARYSEEEKEARVADFCTVAAGKDPCPGLGFTRGVGPTACILSFPAAGDRGSATWSDLTPKVGLQYFFTDAAQVYGFVTDGFRSGGYNLRNALAGVKPGPFDPEELRSYEVGGKADWLESRLRTNVAFFYNEISKMQREINVPTAAGGGGLGQSIRNAADAVIKGAELEVLGSVTPQVLLSGNIGYTDGAYVPGSLLFDLNGDNVINSVDEKLRIPRLAKLTWGIGADYDRSLGEGRKFSAKVNFNHRDGAAFTDNNRGTLNTVDMVDVATTLSLMDERLSIGLYGKNLTNQVIEGNQSVLGGAVYSGLSGNTDPNVFGSFRPLMKGRVWGLELNYRL